MYAAFDVVLYIIVFLDYCSPVKFVAANTSRQRNTLS